MFQPFALRAVTEPERDAARQAAGRRFRQATLLVGVLAVVLRVALALVNLEANDRHDQVINAIAFENRIPEFPELLEAFQPKLYHVTIAMLWRAMATQSATTRVHAAELVTCLSGILTLFIADRFLGLLNLSPKTRFLSFALAALNPKFLGINAQITNDSFVILFVTLSLYFGWAFFNRWTRSSFVWMTVAAILAALSKGNGLFVSTVILAVFGVSLVLPNVARGPTRKQLLGYMAAFVVSFLAVVPWLGPYWRTYQREGTPFAINQTADPFPSLIQKSYVRRPGVTSIVDSYFTFRFLGMLREPMITNDKYNYPLHRTSLWSQLYGRTHFVQFDAWPGSWETHEPFVDNLGRLILVVALWPTLLLLSGMLRAVLSGLRAAGKWVRLKPPYPAKIAMGEVFVALAPFAYLAFVVAYTLQYRDFSTMKAIFIFPAGLGFLLLFARECDRFYRWARSTWMGLAADFAFALLLGLYAIDVGALIFHLYGKS